MVTFSLGIKSIKIARSVFSSLGTGLSRIGPPALKTRGTGLPQPFSDGNPDFRNISFTPINTERGYAVAIFSGHGRGTPDRARNRSEPSAAYGQNAVIG